MWTWLKDGTFWLISWFYQFVGDWGMAIILITVLFRLIIHPLTIKQFKSTHTMEKLKPQQEAIQAKYADDQEMQQKKLRELYSEVGFNPFSGCLPILLQMPIFLILFQVLQEYLPGGSNFYMLIPDLTQAPGSIWASGDVGATIPYVVLMLIFAVSMFVPMLLQNQTNPQQRKQTLTMGGIMALFMLWISWRSPAGVLLFWDVSSLIGIAQQWIIQKKLKEQDYEEMAQNSVPDPVDVDVVRRVKKPRPTKKSKR